MSDSEGIQTFELCGLLHSVDVRQCDSCQHVLGTERNWQQYRDELPVLRQRILLGVMTLVAMLALNAVVFGGAGFIVAVAPIGWIGASVYRHHLLSTRLRGARQLDGPYR